MAVVQRERRAERAADRRHQRLAPTDDEAGAVLIEVRDHVRREELAPLVPALAVQAEEVARLQRPQIFQGGQPLHITMANSHFSDGGQRPNLTGTKARSHFSEHDVAKNNYWLGGNESMFNSDAFSDPGDNNLGNTPRFKDDLRGDSIKDLDFSIIKNFTIHEGHVVQVRVESFNLTNTPQFNDPNTGWGTGSFGFVNGQVNSPRQLQFGVHYAF